jgi:NAD(P)H-hydrate epimerase
MPLRLVTAAQMQGLDLKATKDCSIPSIVLMENAARSVCEVIEEICAQGQCACSGISGLKVLIVCGKGNNGGDGLAIARLLANRDAQVSVVLLGPARELKNDPKINWDILHHSRVEIHEVRIARQLNQVFCAHDDADVIVDAIFGTGFKGKPQGLFAQAIERMNRMDGLVVAVDIPSGIQADDGQKVGPAVQADATVTMALLKRGLVLYPGKDYCGDVWIGDIGVPANQFDQEGDTWLLERPDCGLPERPAYGHKGTFGTALVIGGSPGYSGAACLASMATLRIGCGLSKLALPVGLLGIAETKLLEVVKFGLPQTPEGALGLEALPATLALLATADALAIGPGIGTLPETRDLELKVLRSSRVPIVIDADGVSNLARSTGLLRALKVPVILTPHPGELSRLIDVSPEAINRDRIEIARRTAQDFRVVLVLKGAPTVVASPGGQVYVNPTGNSGLGSGGTGDVLTGMIAGLMAQGQSALEAAKTGVYLHGLAADLAAEQLTEYALVAGDLLDYLGAALKRIENRDTTGFRGENGSVPIFRP